MPGYKTHLCGGLVVFLSAVALLLSITDLPGFFELSIYLSCALLGSIFPDIDVASKMQRLFFVGSTGVLSCALLTNRTHLFLVIGGCVLLVTLLRHRTLTHQIGFLVSMPIFFSLGAVYLYNLPFNFVAYACLFFVAGCVSHVVLDRTKTKLTRLFLKR